MSDRLAAAVVELVSALREEMAVTATSPDGPVALLSVEEAARRLGLGRTTVYGELSAGRLHSIKIGRRRLLSSDAIEAFAREAGAP